MRWDIEKAAQYIKEGAFEYLEGLEFTEEERALIEAILYIEREYPIDVVQDLKEKNAVQALKIKALERELNDLYDLLGRISTTFDVIERPLGEIKGDIDAFLKRNAEF